MPFFIKKRNSQLTELMEQPDCDKEVLFNTYRQFKTLNSLISGWRGIFKKFIKPVLAEKPGDCSLLDIGCGGGDVLLFLNSLAEKDDFRCSFTGIDPDPNAYEFVSNQQWPDNVTFYQTSSKELARMGRSFDVVISNHLLHHLHDSQLSDLCNSAQQLASRKVIFNDIERSDIGYLSFKIAATPLFRNSFIVPDGLTSIKRSYRKQELQNALPDGWHVHRKFPYRLLAVYNSSKS